MPNPTLAINFTGNISPLLASLQKANGGLAGFSDSVTGGGNSLADLAKGAGLTALAMKGLDAAVGLVQSGVGALGAMVAKGIGLAAAAEQAQVGFEVMLKSAAKARDMLGQIRQFAAATPFESKELISASQALLSMGVNAKEVVSTLRVLGDVASASGGRLPITDLAVMYGKMNASGRVMNDDLRQMAERGIPIMDQLAKEMGVPTTSIRKLAEQGKISFGVLRNAMINLTSQGGLLEGMTQRQSVTLAGLWSTLKDNIDMSLMGMGERITSTFELKGAIAALSGFVERGGAMLTEFAKSAAAALAPVVGAFGGWEGIFKSLAAAAIPCLGATADGIQTAAKGLLLFKFEAIKLTAWAAKQGIKGDGPGANMMRAFIDANAKVGLDQTEGKFKELQSQGSAGDALAAKLKDLMATMDRRQGEPIAAPAALKKVDPTAGNPLEKLKGIFPISSMLAGLPGAIANMPSADTLNKRLEKMPGRGAAGGPFKESRNEYRSVGAAEMGSSEAYSSIAEAFNKSNGSKEAEVVKIQQNQLELLNRIFQRILRFEQGSKQPRVAEMF